MEDTVMRKNLSALPLLAFGTLIAPLQAIAQTQQQPTAPPQNYYWPGPWHMMWGYDGWPFWGMFPMMLLFLGSFVWSSFSSFGVAWAGCPIGDHRSHGAIQPTRHYKY
jgi:hypothetical protein